MKTTKLKLLFVCLLSLVLTTVSCSSDLDGPDEVLDSEGAISLLATPTEFYRILFNFADRYAQRDVPLTVAEENLMKISFSAAYAHYLSDGQFGDHDIYSPVYQGWRIESGLRSAQANPAVADFAVEDVLRMIAEGSTAFRIAALTAVSPGENYMEIMGRIKNRYENFDTQTDSEKIVSVFTDLGVGDFNVMMAMNMHAMSITPQVDALLAYRDDGYAPSTPLPYAGCFTVHDGMDYLYGKYPADPYGLSVLEIFYPVLFAMNESGRMQFINDLADYCDSNPALYDILPKAQLDKMIECLSIAAGAMNWWGEDEIITDPGSLNVDRIEYEFNTWNKMVFSFNIYSNTNWEISTWYSILGGASADKYSGSGDDVVTITLEAGAWIVGNPPSLGDVLENIIYIRYERVPGETEVVEVTAKRYYYPEKELSASYTNPTASGGQVSVNVNSNCRWMPTTMSSWISLVSLPAAGYYEGNGSFGLYIASNPNTVDRSGSFQIRYKYDWEDTWEVKTFNVDQPGQELDSQYDSIKVNMNHINIFFDIGKDVYYGYDNFTFNWTTLETRQYTAEQIRQEMQTAFNNAGVSWVRVATTFDGSNPAEDNKIASRGTFTITTSGAPSTPQLVCLRSAAQYHIYLNMYFNVRKP